MTQTEMLAAILFITVVFKELVPPASRPAGRKYDYKP
jgi:hypothetical protein